MNIDPDLPTKPWFRSSTILTSAAQILGGLILIVLAAFSVVPVEWSAYGVGQVALGAQAIRGRVNASTAIAPVALGG